MCTDLSVRREYSCFRDLFERLACLLPCLCIHFGPSRCGLNSACDAVVLVVCGIILLLLGGYYMLRWSETVYRQRLRRINADLKNTRRSSRHFTHSPRMLSWTPPLCSPLLWLPAAITIIVVLWLHPHMPPMSPTAHPPVLIHSTHKDVVLPPSLQPAYAQWFDPPQRDHVHWLEHLGSVAQKLPWRNLFLVQYVADPPPSGLLHTQMLSGSVLLTHGPVRPQVLCGRHQPQTQLQRLSGPH